MKVAIRTLPQVFIIGTHSTRKEGIGWIGLKVTEQGKVLSGPIQVPYVQTIMGRHQISITMKGIGMQGQEERFVLGYSFHLSIFTSQLFSIVQINKDIEHIQ